MDNGSEIDWEALDNELDNMEAEALASEGIYEPGHLSEESYDEPTEEPTEMVELQEDAQEDEEPENLEEALIEACQKYFEIQTDAIEQLVMPASWVKELQELWLDFNRRVGSRQAAGEAIYDAVKEAAPRIVIDDFKIPRPVWSSRFVDGISSLIAEASDLKMLRKRAEAMGFSHISLAVTIEKCALLRDVTVSVVEQEYGPGQFAAHCNARKALTIVLNYIAGALLNTQDMFGSRVMAIKRSWRQASNTHREDPEMDESEETNQPISAHGKLNAEDIDQARFREMSQAAKKRRKGLNVPKTFNEMFLFNSCVMGYQDSEWMDLVLDRFNALATNVCQLLRLQEECDVLSLALTRYLSTINFSEFKTVLLATLRSLVKGWNMEMDVAWTWFWDRIVAMLTDRKTLLAYKKKLGTALATADEQTFQSLRTMLFEKFFQDKPTAQEYLKTSMTRLYFVADRIIQMTFDLFEHPEKMIEEITSVALLHVGTNIPREFFKPFRRSAQKTFEAVMQNDVASQGFSWSILLVTRVMTRVIAAGSTVVMKAVCLRNETALRASMAIAPRSERALHLLSVRAGGQTTSPLYWAIDSGSLRIANIIIEDLLTIRADRKHYYYGCDTLFDIHPDLINHLCFSAPTLLQPLLDGLVWRSRSTQQGMRRVNYIKNLLQDKDGGFSKNIEWLVNYDDPQAISHRTSTLAVNIVWSGLAVRFFLAGRAFFMLSLCAFMAGQSVLVRHDGTESYENNIALAGCRAFTFLLSMGSLILDHVKHLYVSFHIGAVHRTALGVPIPSYLCNMRELLSLILAFTLLIMLLLEPILWCLGELSDANSPFEYLTTICKQAEVMKNVHSSCASFAALLYWLLIMDLAVFSMRLYAFLLVCGQVIWEVLLFLVAAIFLILAFSTTLNALDHSIGVEGVPAWSRKLGQVITETVPTSFYPEIQATPIIGLTVSLFSGIISFLLLNLLAGQLIHAYPSRFQDLEGRAQLSRAGILVRMMEQVGHKTFTRFIESLHFDEPLEFNEGDIGLAGGVQVLENANDSVVTVDRICRYGGSTSPSLPWPEDEKKTSVRQERLERLENLFLKASKDDSSHRIKGGKSFARKAQKKRSLTFTNAMAAFNGSYPTSDASQ